MIPLAKIDTKSRDVVYQIQRWLGVNENPDGDTKLKMGEAAEMRNFKITRDGNLQIRPGTKTMFTFPGPVRGIWHGNVSGMECTIAAAGGNLWIVPIGTELTPAEIGTLTDAPTEFFGFGGKLYILNGHEYMVWDGIGDATIVSGYVPLVSTANPPEGGGTLLEGVNKLTGARRARYSPDGTATVFHLPETNVESIDYVKDLLTGTAITHTSDLAAGTVTISTAPAKGVNSIEIGWTMADNDRATIEGMRFSEFYSGATDTRVFLYGDGTNRAVYSGLDNNGRPTAEYFPDLNVLHAGEANTPITGLVRHFTMLLIFKSNSAYIAGYDTMELSGGALTSALFLRPINRDIGNAAMGQVRLITNNPLTLHGSGVYEWKSGGGYLSMDERNAKRVSGRVGGTLGSFHLPDCMTFDDEESQEYYIFDGDRAIVYNYDEDTWYIYTDFPCTAMLTVGGELYAGNADGEVRHVARKYRSDDGAPIDAYWRSGSMPFDREWMRKYSSRIYVTIKPESGARVAVTARSDRKSNYTEKVIVSSLSTFESANFGHWSFSTNRQPQVIRAKLKVKKVAFYQLIFESNSAEFTATVLTCDMSVRYTGNVK